MLPGCGRAGVCGLLNGRSLEGNRDKRLARGDKRRCWLSRAGGVAPESRPMCSHVLRQARLQRGFTVIELVIAVIVVGVLTAVALPSFLDSMRKGRRSEAFSALSAVQQAQERWRSNRASFTGTLSDLGINATTNPGGYYTLSIASASPTGYEIQAQAAGSQVNDTQCTKLGVKVEAGAISYGGCSGCSTLTFAPTNSCWAR